MASDLITLWQIDGGKVETVRGFIFLVCKVMYGCESWIIKKVAHQRINAFEFWCWRRLLRVPWIAKRSNQSILKEINSEAPILWPPDMKSWLIGKDPDGGKDWRREEKGKTEDEMVGWHHQLNGREFEWTPGVGDGQGGLACCNSWGRKELDTTEQLNWTELKHNSKVQVTKIQKEYFILTFPKHKLFLKG